MSESSSQQLEAVPTADPDTIDGVATVDDRLVILLNAEGLCARAPAVEELPAAA